MALLLPPLARRERGGAPLDLACDRQRRAPHLGERPPAIDADVHVDAARARGLWPPDEADIGEHLAHDPRDVLQLRPCDSGHRVEVDAELVGMIEVVGAYRVRVELEAAEVRHPRERGGVTRDDLLRFAPRREP